MANLEIKKALQSYGLEEKEIRVYLAVLRLGNGTAREIAELSKIKRTTVYVVAEKLVEKGIFGVFTAKYGTHYITQSPTSLLNRLDNIKKGVQNILPQLEAIENKGHFEPSVAYYQGKMGYLEILEDSLACADGDILYLGSEDLLANIIGEKYIVQRYIPKRIAKKISFKELLVKDKLSAMMAKPNNELREVKFLPVDFACGANTLIYRDKVAYFSSQRELVAVLISSRDIALTERQKFNLLWERTNSAF